MKIVFTSGAPAVDLFEKLDDTKFNLIVIGQAAPNLRNDWPIVVHEIPDLATNIAVLAKCGIRPPSYYLLRPDGYIGLAGVRLQRDDVRRYYAERFT